MTWRDLYEQGSFRGARFVTERHERSGGRRVVLHEFPGRDEPLAEDMGRRMRASSFECFVHGVDYIPARDALVAALEEPGPGVLVHPWLGASQVVVLDFRLSESTDEGGMARFSIDFGEAGLPQPALGAIDASSRLTDGADAIAVAAPVEFADRFTLAGVPSFVEDAAARLVSGAANLTALVAGINGGAGPALRAFEAGLARLPDASLLRQPLALGHAIAGLVHSAAGLGGTARQRVASFSAMVDFGRSAPPQLSAITPARAQERANRSALLHLYAVLSASEMVRAASVVPFASYEDAVSLRDRLSDQLEALALIAADAREDERADAFDRLRRDLVRAITERGGSLARVYAHQLAATQPSLAIANRLYGHARVEVTAGELAARNRIVHPGFVPGGATIEALAYG